MKEERHQNLSSFIIVPFLDSGNPIHRSSVKRWTVYHSCDTPCVDGVINGMLYITPIILHRENFEV